MTSQNKLAQQITGFIWLVIILYVVFLFMGGGKKDTPRQTTEQVTNKQEKYVTISGVERDKASMDYGQIVVQEINVWENAGVQRGRVVGKLPHGTKVKVLEEKTTDQKYYKITTDTLFYEGWVSEQLVQE